ncbi:anti-sigma factor domain-containing protein [Terriglobus albidus]|uniref:anti-sigma factor domain-containing protein n=1 Tax=Terriglobus albidus TaxID=1592106 RepID=UPI0021E0022E|nr:hypothetical protein [Terriglobus albidus]
MNAHWHDEFVTLCALYPSGELTEEEWALLQVHLVYCESCQRLFAEYQQIANEIIPGMAAANAEEDEPPSESLDLAEERLMAALDRASSSTNENTLPRSNKVLAVLAVAAGLIGIGWFGLHLRTPKEPAWSAQTIALQPRNLPSTPAAKNEANLESELRSARGEIIDLRTQLDRVREERNQADVRLIALREQFAKEQKEREDVAKEKDILTSQLALTRGELQYLQEKTALTADTSKQYLVRIAALESRVRDLSGTVEDKDRSLTLDKELLAHDRDIRELIAARDLYIADIQDVAQNGKTSKSFGRIFYTKDKSLVFYGYDLDKQPGLKQSVAFQAWGSDGDQRNISLGLFYQDDSKKRWVLRFNDTKTLAHLNKVFVTAEPQGGSPRPTGKPLLMAYLQMQPNHP